MIHLLSPVALAGTDGGQYRSSVFEFLIGLQLFILRDEHFDLPRAWIVDSVRLRGRFALGDQIRLTIMTQRGIGVQPRGTSGMPCQILQERARRRTFERERYLRQPSSTVPSCSDHSEDECR